MIDVQALLDKINTIAIGDVSSVQAEVEAVKSSIAELSVQLSANAMGDNEVASNLASLEVVVNSLIDKLAAAPAPVEPPAE